MFISDLSGCNLVGLASSLSIIIAQDLTSEEIGILGDFFNALGDNLSLLSNNTSSTQQNNDCKPF